MIETNDLYSLYLRFLQNAEGFVLDGLNGWVSKDEFSRRLGNLSVEQRVQLERLLTTGFVNSCDATTRALDEFCRRPENESRHGL